jgi:hypothetical protein
MYDLEKRSIGSPLYLPVSRQYLGDMTALGLLS